MLLDLEEKTRVLVEDIVERSAIGSGSIFVLGLSSSEVVGGIIGKASSREIGQRIVKTILEVLEPKGIYLAVQGCEHLNRALVVERELALAKDLEIVNVLPTLHAGGSGQLAAFDYLDVRLMPQLNRSIAENSIYDYLENQLHLSISHAFKEITIDNTSEQDKILIDIGKDHHVVCIRSKVYLNNGNQFQFTESRHKLEKFKFVYYAKRHH